MHLPTPFDRLKVIKHILSWMIWSVVALYILLMTLIYLPPFQDWLGQRVSHAISGKLGTSAHVGTVQLSFPNRFIIDDVDILDQHQQPMVRIGRLSTKLQWLPLAEGRIVISSAQLFGARINIQKSDSLSPTNIQCVLDALSSNDTTSQSPLDLRINSLIIRHSHVSYDQLDASLSERLNPKHLKFSDISSHLLLKALTDDTLSVNVKRLTFNEQCGLSVNNLSFQLQAGTHGAILKDFTLQLPHSMLTVDSLKADFLKGKVRQTLNYRLNDLQADIKISDLKGFLPNLQNYSDVITLSTSIEGDYDDINVDRLVVNTTGNKLSIQANGWIYDLHHHHPQWRVKLSELALSKEIGNSLTRDFANLPKQLTHLGDFSLSGVFEGDAQGKIATHSLLTAETGKMDLHFELSPDKSFTGSVMANDVDLGKILDDEQFGHLATSLHLQGTSDKVYAKGAIDQFTYNGYSYSNANIDAHYSKNDIGGKININDPHLIAQLEGIWKKKGKRMSVTASGNIDKIAPHSLHLSDFWGDAYFSSRINANFDASNLNDAEGTIALSDFVKNDSTGIFRINAITLMTGYVNDKHFLKMNGDIGDATLVGNFDWNTLPKSVVSCLSSRLTDMSGIQKVTEQLNNDFELDLYLLSSDWLQEVFNLPISLAYPLRLKGNLDDLSHSININANIPAFYYDDAAYGNANLHLTTIGDSIVCLGNVVKDMDNGLQMEMFFQSGVRNNNINTRFAWDNHTDGIKAMAGSFSASTTLYTNDQGLPEAQIHTHTSRMKLGDTQWEINPSDIFYNNEYLLVDHFSMQHDSQHLIIDGFVSDDAKDTLIIDMKDIDISYVLDLLNFHPVDFAGYVSGRAQASQLFSEPTAEADISVKQFKFEGGRLGTLRAKAEWNKEEQQIDIDAVADEGQARRTLIKGFVSPVREDIELNIKGEGTNIEFLKTYTDSFLKNVSGQAYGEVQLIGPLGAMDLLGTLVVDGKATVIPLGTTYTLRKDTVKLVKDDILLNRASIYDINNDVAYLSGGIHHKNLSDMTFDLDIVTDKLLAYDFTELGDDLFCGTVVAQGKVDMHGRPGEVVINCDATALKPTVFTYNAASSNSVSQQDFISWHSKNKSTPRTRGQAVVEESKDSVANDVPTDIFINFFINAAPDATVKLLMDANTNDYITLFGSGGLRATYHNKGAFQLFGTYTVDHGTYGITIQNIIKKNFVFQEGSTIVFGGNPMEASLQMQAVYTVNGVSLSDLNIGNSFTNNTVRVNCLMNITGQAGAPRVDFDLDMPTVNSDEKQMIRSIISTEQEMNQQVLYLLGIGRFYTQGTNNAETQEYGQTELAMQSFLSGTLSTQINEFISQAIKNDDWNFGANISTGNEGWHNAEYEGLISGRMLNNRLLINGQFGYRDNAIQATPSFIGDFDIRYLLTPNGNLALKMYNQTNDRYFTRSSLNTQGLGLIIKRDFDSVADLFKRKKKK